MEKPYEVKYKKKLNQFVIKQAYKDRDMNAGYMSDNKRVYNNSLMSN